MDERSVDRHPARGRTSCVATVPVRPEDVPVGQPLCALAKSHAVDDAPEVLRPPSFLGDSLDLPGHPSVPGDGEGRPDPGPRTDVVERAERDQDIAGAGDEVRPDARPMVATRIRGGGQGRERPGLAAVVAAAHADRAARSAVGGGPVAGHRDVEAAGRGVDIDAMQPHRVGTDVSGGARCAQPAEREAGLLDGRRDPGRTDVECLRLRVEIHASDDHGESSHVGRTALRKDPRPIPSAKVGLVPRGVHAAVGGQVEADTRSATSPGSRAASEPGRSRSSSTSCRSPRTLAGGTRGPARHERASCSRRRPFRSRGWPGRGPRRSPETLRPTAACAARRGALTTWRLHRH